MRYQFEFEELDFVNPNDPSRMSNLLIWTAWQIPAARGKYHEKFVLLLTGSKAPAFH